MIVRRKPPSAKHRVAPDIQAEKIARAVAKRARKAAKLRGLAAKGAIA